jgi:hypothetical protein
MPLIARDLRVRVLVVGGDQFEYRLLLWRVTDKRGEFQAVTKHMVLHEDDTRGARKSDNVRLRHPPSVCALRLLSKVS